MGNDNDVHRSPTGPRSIHTAMDETPTRGAAAPADSDRPGPEVPPVEVQPPPQGASPGGPNDLAISGGRRGWVARIFPGRNRRDLQLQTLQAGYAEMLDLMRSISSHLDRQAESQTRLLQSLERFPEAVEGLQNVGKATEQQTRVLNLVRDQLESTAKHEQDMAGSMTRFNETLHLMDATNRATSSTVSDLVERSQTAETELRSMLERSQQRLTLLSGVLGVIGVVVIGGMIYVGLTQRGDPQTALTAPPAAPEPETQSQMADDGKPALTEGDTAVIADADGAALGPESADIFDMEVLSAEPTDPPETEPGPAAAEEPIEEPTTVEPAPEAAPDAPAAEPLESSPDDALDQGGPDTARTEAGDSDEIVGIRNVFLRVFSFIGDEETETDPSGETLAMETVPEGAGAHPHPGE